MKITTKTGDYGTTGMVDEKKRVKKTNPRKVVNGTLDELNSFLGLARSLNTSEKIAGMLYRMQEELFLIGSEVASTPEDISILSHRIEKKHVLQLERLMDSIEKEMPMPENFVIPGGTRGSAAIDVARAVARRLERKAVEAHDQGLIQNRFIMKYLNRLSDVLFTLARYVEFLETGEARWPEPRKW